MRIAIVGQGYVGLPLAIAAADLQEEGLSASRIKKCLLVLQMVMNEAVNSERISRNPLGKGKLEKPSLPKSIPAAFTLNEIKQLSQSMPVPYQLLTEFLCFTGLRMGEVVSLRVKNLDLQSGLLTVETSAVYLGGKLYTTSPKSGHSRRVPLSQHLIGKLQSHVKNKSDESFVFSSPVGEQLDADQYRRTFKRKVREMGKPTMTPHNCRDTAASLAIRAGASVKTVAQMLGHADASITLTRYTAFFPDDFDSLRLALGKISGR